MGAVRTPTRVCVVGLGYVGLPTACMLAISGVSVIGVDNNVRVLERLRNRAFQSDEPDLQKLVEDAIDSGNLTLANQTEPADAFIIAVPTPIDEHKHADLRFVLSAAEAIALVLQRGNLVVVESTVPPRTCVDLVAPVLEQYGLKQVRDFHLAHCPERVLPGSIVRELVHNERTIGGVSPRCAELAVEIYATFVRGPISVTDCTTAEMTKLMENTYRDVNVALANEFALMSEKLEVDVWEAIRLANNHPRVNVLRPGPGVGGHCVAVDPWFLVEATPRLARVTRASRVVNDGMPAHVAAGIRKSVSVNDGAVVLLGAAYKGNTDDARESPALAVFDDLTAHGYEVRVVDPRVAVIPGNRGTSMSIEEAAVGASAVVLLADHAEFQSLDVRQIARRVSRKLLIDTRNALPHRVWRENGFVVRVLGNGKPAEPTVEVGPVELVRAIRREVEAAIAEPAEQMPLLVGGPSA